MSRPARALLSAQALKHNLSQVRRFAPNSRVMAVVKANAYGHGLQWAVSVLKEADGFGVASTEEGIAAREALGEDPRPICLLEGVFTIDEIGLAAAHRFEIVVHTLPQLDLLAQSAPAVPLTVWVKIDTGMHRLGFAPEDGGAVVDRLRGLPAVGEVRLMTHFANADARKDPTTKRQLKELAPFIQPGTVASAANSAGIVGWPASHHDWVRPGIMLYGGSPMHRESAASFDLKPVMTLQTALLAVTQRKKGDAIGYGGDFVCPSDIPVGVAAVGYGDGYPRHAHRGTPVLVNGRRVPLIGRVSMDMITLDLRGQAHAQPGDPVVLWGNNLPIDDIANCAGTISYELMCHVTERIPRVPVLED